MRGTTAVEAEGLRKSYGSVEVLRGIDLSVPRGGVFALLGPNGAGKTTTVRILATLAQADAGRAVVAGADVRRERSLVRRRISLTGQYASVDEMLTGAENLRLTARLAGHPRRAARRRADELLERFALGGAAGRRVATYSGGMRRRLDIAACLVGTPEVVFLDEPSTGLDPRSRQTLWDVVRELASGGVTVLLTTQYLEEADQLAGRLAVVDGGRVVAEGGPAELKARVGGRRLHLALRDADAYTRLVSALGPRAVHRDPEHRTVELATDGGAAHVRALLDEVDPTRGEVTRFEVRGATLDDVFLTLTGTPPTAPAHAAGSHREEPVRG
ncbi:daunorubicin resistance protein DrrA family ABC transporter ATP-binding protein [Streptomyces chumphonensis]|uniref:ABC-type xenobiotic transporter n=1 Tax=Streptomyces chumphonensis TaxID=1214925 RepID=A0A927EXG1_9ACTN|nr:ATP-binding cassette domain-containing protein [Streptomyces chumphonensis]MBD3931175.1 ATP-binding cassette domain-containing protein [Streptomyces chumphonensis]